MSIFTGAGVALITPMNPDGSINYPEMEHIINDQIAGGTDAVIVCGTTGETATMTYDEHIETIRACVQMTAGRIPVIAGTGSNCTKSAVNYPLRQNVPVQMVCWLYHHITIRRLKTE